MWYPSRFSDIATRRGLGALALGFVTLPAWAQGRHLDAPRAEGLVGERYDGLAVVRGATPPDIVALVARVNAERTRLYAQRAEADKVSAAAVGRIYAGQIMQHAPAGTWLLAETGQWTRK